jgi:HEPN domain-containing protein
MIVVQEGSWAMNRFDSQKLASLRLREAKALLAAGFPEGAYYLAGYAVECALKACLDLGLLFSCEKSVTLSLGKL